MSPDIMSMGSRAQDDSVHQAIYILVQLFLHTYRVSLSASDTGPFCVSETLSFNGPSFEIAIGPHLNKWHLLDLSWSCLFGLHLWQMEVLRLGVEVELQLPATAIAMWDPSLICDLHHSLQQHWILNPIKPTSLWILVRFISAEPQWELPEGAFNPPVSLESEADAGPFLQLHHPVECSMLGRDPFGTHEREPYLSHCPPKTCMKPWDYLPQGIFLALHSTAVLRNICAPRRFLVILAQV